MYISVVMVSRLMLVIVLIVCFCRCCMLVFSVIRLCECIVSLWCFFICWVSQVCIRCGMFGVWVMIFGNCLLILCMIWCGLQCLCRIFVSIGLVIVQILICGFSWWLIFLMFSRVFCSRISCGCRVSWQCCVMWNSFISILVSEICDSGWVKYGLYIECIVVFRLLMCMLFGIQCVCICSLVMWWQLWLKMVMKFLVRQY